MRPWPESDRPRRLELAVERMLAGEPGDRFGSMSEALDELAAALGVRGQIASLTKRWEQSGRDRQYLLPSGDALDEAAAVLVADRRSLTDEQAALIEASLANRSKRRLRRRLMLGTLVILLLGLLPTLYLLDRRTRQLDARVRAQAETASAAVRRRVESLFQRNEQAVHLMYEQREVWMGSLVALRATDDPALLEAHVHTLNRFFRPVVEEYGPISSLMVATEDTEYLLFEDAGGASLSPPYRFYARIVNEPRLGGKAFELFLDGPEGPRRRWLDVGEPDSRGQPWRAYHPGERVWFRAAEVSDVGWTHPYLFYVTKDAGFTGAIAWDREGETFVLAVDFMLTDLSAVTRRVSEPGLLVAVVTEDGGLVALPGDPRFDDDGDVREFFARFDAQREADVAATLPRIADLGIRELTAGWEAARDSDDLVAVEHEGRRLWAGTSPVGSEDQALRVLVVAWAD